MQDRDDYQTIIDLMEMIDERTGTIDDASNMMHKLLTQVRIVGKKGRMVITFDVLPIENEVALVVDCHAKVTVMPELPRRKAIVYYDEINKELSETDPFEDKRVRDKDDALREQNEQNITRIGRGPDAA